MGRGRGREGWTFNNFLCYFMIIYIDYKTGESSLDQTDLEQTDSQAEGEIRGNSRSKIYHCPGQAAYEQMADSKYLVIFKSEQEAENEGYRKAKR